MVDTRIPDIPTEALDVDAADLFVMTDVSDGATGSDKKVRADTVANALGVNDRILKDFTTYTPATLTGASEIAVSGAAGFKTTAQDIADLAGAGVTVDVGVSTPATESISGTGTTQAAVNIEVVNTIINKNLSTYPAKVTLDGTEVIFINGSERITALQVAGLAGALTFVDIDAGQGGVAGEFYRADATLGAITITLPASPTNNQQIGLSDAYGMATTNIIKFARNGKTILGDASDLIIDKDRGSATLTYDSGTGDWAMHKGIGGLNV